MIPTFTHDQLVAWLSAVHADPALTPYAFRVAFALSQAVDAGGFVRSSTLSKLPRTDGAGEAEPIADVLGRLIARGLLEACGNQRKIDGFRIKAQPAASSAPRRRRSASVLPFPAARRQAFIHKQAARMAALSPTQAEAHLRQQLRIQADTMRRRGIAAKTVGGEIKSIESAIRAELWKCIFFPETPEKPA